MNPSDLPHTPAPTTILVVDDSVSVRKALERILAPQGYVVRMADSAENALLNLEPLPDMILADILMPGMSGLELARTLGDRHVNVPVMLMSGIVDDVTQRDASSAGACGVLRKPFTPTELLPAIEPHLQAALAARKNAQAPAADAALPAAHLPEAHLPTAHLPTAHLPEIGMPAIEQAPVQPPVPAVPAIPEVPAAPQAPAPALSPLEQLVALNGVVGAAQYGPDGQARAHAGQAIPEAFGMYSRFLLTTATTAGLHLQRGDLSSLHLAYGEHTLLITPHQDGQLVALLSRADAAPSVQQWQAAQHN